MKKVVFLFLIAVLAGCGSNGSSSNNGDAGSGADSPQCSVGSAQCSCYPNATCNAGLSCISGVCLPGDTGGSGGATGGSGGATGGSGGEATGGSGSGGTSGAGGGTGGAGGGGGGGGGGNPDAPVCTTGTERCDCYGNGTCNQGLVCLSNLCVAAPTGGTGGATGGAGGATGGAGGATGGAGGAGGATGGTGGTPACTTGTERCDCYGNGTCNQGLVCLSSLCVVAPTGGTGGATGGSGGATGGSGGATGGSGGTTGGSGGATGGSGGATGGSGGATGGSGGATGGSGGAIGGPLVFTAGYVLASTNSFGIEGPVYTFSDSYGSTIVPDCYTGTCYGDLNGTGPVCAQGVGEAVPYDLPEYYGLYWGAALGLEMNHPLSATSASPYAASQHGVKGFSFNLTNNAAGTTVRLNAEIRDPLTGNSIDYCVNLMSGPNTIRPANLRTNCWTTGGTVLTTAAFDYVVKLQWQVPTMYYYQTPFSFCVDSITPLTQ